MSKDHLLWKEVITAETHLMGIFIQGKVSRYKPTRAAVNYKPYKIPADSVLITIGVSGIKKQSFSE